LFVDQVVLIKHIDQMNILPLSRWKKVENSWIN